ncbi:MAG: hypothetical protein KGY66_05590 [Candidatus Thermoplasmatota archaeon]|nr:hypothetical protein [Candidatus Thermoplasmatota archaeon]MBS3790371.1 hypothetical protein [Candidatus Thermoplasmatota archaeon]
MSEVEKTMRELEWKKRLQDIRFDEEIEDSNSHTSNILVAFLIGFLFGLILAGILLPYITGVV